MSEAMVDAKRLNALLETIRRVRLAVVGDYFLDRYGEGRIHGVSRETGRRVLRLSRHTFSPGGTGNVAANAAALGARVFAVGVVGDDHYGAIYRQDLAQRGIEIEHLATDPGRLTCSFEKFFVERPGGRFREVRLDVDNRAPVAEAVTQGICRSLASLAGAVDAVVVADYEEYGAGVITQPVLDRLLAMAKAGGVPCLAMSRTRITRFLPFVPVQNEYEVVSETGVGRPRLFDQVPDEAVSQAAGVLLGAGTPMVFVTRGERGTSVFTPSQAPRRVAGQGPPALAVDHTLVPAAPVKDPVDTCGAGDTVLAAVAAALAAGAAPVEAAFLGNGAARVTIRKLHTTGTATPEEIRAECARVQEAGQE